MASIPPVPPANAADVALPAQYAALAHDRTAETRTAELEARAALLQTIIDTVPQTIMLLGADGSLLDMSRSGLEMLQADSLGQLAGQSVYPLVCELYRNAFRELTEAVFHGEQRQMEFEIVGLRGARRWLTIQAVPLRNAAGEITAALGILQDITERMQLFLRMQLFEILAETALYGVAFASLDGVLEYANPALRTMSGFGDELVGIMIPDLFAPEDQPYFVETMLPALREHGKWTGTLPARRPDGTIWMAHTNIVTLVDQHGAPSKLASVCHDVTLQQATERRLRLVEVMVENAPDGFSFTELDGAIGYLNPAFRALLGYAETPIGAPLLQFFAEHEHGRIPQLMQVVMTQGSWQGAIGYRRADGSLFDAQLTAFVVRDQAGTPVGLAGIARDLSEEQQRERERIALQEQVIQAQQAALRELSTPLIPIAEGIVAMPLIGSIDSSRAQMVLETLLEGVAATHASTAILDITGVPVVDTQVANALLRAAHAVKLLGAHVVLTGIRPEVAQTLIGLGADLSGIVTRATLQSGVAFGMGRG